MPSISWSGVLAVAASCAAASCGGGTADETLVLRVDRQWEPTAQNRGIGEDALLETSYHARPPRDAYEVKIAGDTIALTRIGAADGLMPATLSGTRQAQATVGTLRPGDVAFGLPEGHFAGGQFVRRGDDGELTLFGSGVPVVSSERGKLVPR